MSSHGSEWKKWDLHVHTKDTNKNDQFKSQDFDTFCSIFFKKAIENNISAIGITDYFCIENYKKVKIYVAVIDANKDFTNDEKKSIKNIFLLPNVELRMLPTTDKKRLINIHCIFNPDEDYIVSLDNGFFSSIEHAGGSGLKFKMNRQGMIDLGKNLDDSLKDEEAYKKGIENFVVEPATLQKLLDENKKLRENTIVIVSNSNNDGASGIQKHYDMFENEFGSLGGVRKTIYTLSELIFSSNKKDIDYFLGNSTSKEEVIKNRGSLKACIHGCDAHNEDKLFIPTENRYCWIKADTSFEGLKQIIYEPEYRVKIQELKPQSSLHKLEEIKLSFDENVQWGNDIFCFAGFDKSITLSPYLTCIIGGRGSGKSTLLNLVAEKIDKESNSFFKDLTEKDRKSSVDFIPEIVENIEFLAQNTIEKFATDNKAFTEAIFQRLDRNSSGVLNNSVKEATKELLKFDDYIELLKNRKSLHDQLRKEKEALKRDENLIKAFQDTEYIEPRNKLQIVQQQINELNKSKETYKELFLSVKNLVDTNILITTPKNNYEEYFNDLYKDIEKVYTKYSEPNKYDSIKKEISGLEDQSKEYSQKIEVYLTKKGMSPENINDAKRASTNIENIKHKIKELKFNLLNIKKEKNKFSTDIIDKKISDFKELINTELNIINNMFKTISDKNPSEIKSIKVMYTLNQDIFDKVFSSFIATLELDSEISSSRKKIKEFLSSIPLETVLSTTTKEKFLDMVGHKETEAYRVIEKIFLDATNFRIYKVIIEKYKRDLENNKILTVYYDEKTLDNSSFGQKCTAAIIVLLSLGNNPIIIDEPEAHLDSSLIANYLVELIKEQKQKRQIIFATHNANFVLNADAELIIKLENTAGKTNITHFTIEDLNHREDLLKLEGGKEAFKKRERKYNI